MLQPVLATGSALLTCLVAAVALQDGSGGSPQGSQGFDVPVGPRPVTADVFHPDRASPVEPRRGGRVVVHVPGLPRSVNYMIENSSIARTVLHELHEPLIRRDWETWEWTGALAESWSVADTLVRVEGAGPPLHGNLERDGDEWVVTPVPGRDESGPSAPLRVAAADVASVERGSVWTFHLRPDVRWHDGHPLDARDVLFSYECYRNPAVRCDRKRYLFEKIESAELAGRLSVRFVFSRPYFMAASIFDESFTILPSHLYDLSDPDHPEPRDVGTVEQGHYVNEHPGNRAWIGLGPYRLTAWDAQGIEAERFDGYFDARNGGWLDAIRWRGIRDMQAAFQAVLEGEVDFLDRLSSNQFFGPETAGDPFERRAYKGWFYTPYVGYTVWNTKRPALADARVRRALGMVFDWDEFIRTWYHGLAMRATGEQYFPTDNYDRALEPLPYDPRAAEDLLTAAGWYDRDGDGLVDRDGAALSLELAFPAGNETSRAYGLLYQDELARVGVRLELVPLSFAALSEAVGAREFDAVALGWVLDFVSDPEPLWHSRWAEGNSANRSGLADGEVDELIDRIQVELRPGARASLLHRLQRRIHELQPVQFGLYVPRRFALSKRVRNVQLFALDPGYSIRRWWLADEEG